MEQTLFAACGLPRQADSGFLDRHWPDFFLYLNRIDHGDRVPRTTVEETSVWTFAQAFLAADAQDRIDLDAAKRRMIFVRHPEHAIFDWAIFHAGGRSGATGAAFGNDRQLFRFLLARSREALRLRFKLELVGNHPNGFGCAGYRRHAGIIT